MCGCGGAVVFVSLTRWLPADSVCRMGKTNLLTQICWSGFFCPLCVLILQFGLIYIDSTYVYLFIAFIRMRKHCATNNEPEAMRPTCVHNHYHFTLCALFSVIIQFCALGSLFGFGFAFLLRSLGSLKLESQITFRWKLKQHEISFTLFMCPSLVFALVTATIALLCF